MTETWKPVLGYEGHYEASSLGEIRGVGRNINAVCHNTPYTYYKTGNLLQTKQMKDGYLMAHLSKNGKSKHYLVHRLVWEAFNGPVPDGLEINHINEDKTDNRLENLNLMTPSENCRWGTRIKRITKKQKKPVVQMTLAGEEIFTYFSATDACLDLGISANSILKCCSGKYINKSAGGYLWRYVF